MLASSHEGTRLTSNGTSFARQFPETPRTFVVTWTAMPRLISTSRTLGDYFCRNLWKHWRQRNWSTIAIFRVELKQFKKWLSKSSEIKEDSGRGEWPQLSTFSVISEFGYFGVGHQQYFWRAWSSTPQHTSIIEDHYRKNHAGGLS